MIALVDLLMIFFLTTCRWMLTRLLLITHTSSTEPKSISGRTPATATMGNMLKFFFLGDDNAAQQNGTDIHIHPPPRQANSLLSPPPGLPALSCPVAQLPLSESVQVQVGSGQWFRSRPRRRIALRPLLPACFIMEADVPIAAATPRSASAPIPFPELPLFFSSSPSPACSKPVKDPFFPCNYY